MAQQGLILVTGARQRPTPPQAEQWARKLGGKVVPRQRWSLKELAEQHGAWGVLVLEADGVVFHVPAEGVSYFYHPGMARRRIKSIMKGFGDPMVTAMDLRPGDHVLDCTLGRGTDAIIASFVVGDAGRVVGVEAVPVLAALTEHGLRTLEVPQPELQEAMRRVEVVWSDNEEYLAQAEPRSFDVVYFDPLFDRPVEASSAMVPLRALAEKRPLRREVLEKARQVARRCVVVKQRRGTPLWEELPPDRVVAGRKSSVEYGVFAAEA